MRTKQELSLMGIVHPMLDNVLKVHTIGKKTVTPYNGFHGYQYLVLSIKHI